MHVTATKLCTVEYGTGALLDLWDGSILFHYVIHWLTRRSLSKAPGGGSSSAKMTPAELIQEPMLGLASLHLHGSLLPATAPRFPAGPPVELLQSKYGAHLASCGSAQISLMGGIVFRKMRKDSRWVNPGAHAGAGQPASSWVTASSHSPQIPCWAPCWAITVKMWCSSC